MNKETYLFIAGIIMAIIGLCVYSTYTKEVVLLMSEVRGLKSVESLVEAVDGFVTPYKGVMTSEQIVIYETAVNEISDELAKERGELEFELLFQRIGEFLGLSLLVIGIGFMIYGRPKEPLVKNLSEIETRKNKETRTTEEGIEKLTKELHEFRKRTSNDFIFVLVFVAFVFFVLLALFILAK